MPRLHARSLCLPAILVAVATAGAPAAGGAAIIHVDTLVDEAPSSTPNGKCSLREALYAANENVFVDSCPGGEASDVIYLDVVGTYSFTRGDAKIDDGSIQIAGTGSAEDHVINLGLVSRFLTISGGAEVLITDVEVALGYEPGGTGGAILVSESSLTVRDSSFRLNLARDGGAIDFYPKGAAGRLAIERCHFEGNGAIGHPGSGAGGRGGAVAFNSPGLDHFDTAELTIVDSSFVGNEASEAGTVLSAEGGALFFSGFFSAALSVAGSTFVENVAETEADEPTYGFGGAVSLALHGGATASFRDVVMTDNQADFDSAMRAALRAEDTELVMDRVAVRKNRPQSIDGGWQLGVFPDGISRVAVGNLLLEGAPDASPIGLLVGARGEARVDVAAATVVSHREEAIGGYRLDDATVAFNNLVVWSNGIDALGFELSSEDNLVGVDPHFVDAANGDYHLLPSSPAIDAGTAHGLPEIEDLDLDGASREQGLAPDYGAYESPYSSVAEEPIFTDGFESGDTSAWSP